MVEKRQAPDEFGLWDSTEDEFGSWVDKREPHHTEAQIEAKQQAAAASVAASSSPSGTCNNNKKRYVIQHSPFTLHQLLTIQFPVITPKRKLLLRRMHQQQPQQQPQQPPQQHQPQQVHQGTDVSIETVVQPSKSWSRLWMEGGKAVRG